MMSERSFSDTATLRRSLELTPLGATVLRRPGTIDQPYTYLYLNSRLLRLLGGEPDDWLGRAAELHFASPESRELFYAEAPYPETQWGYDVILGQASSHTLISLVWSEPVDFDGIPAVIAWFYDLAQRRHLERTVTHEKALLGCLIDSIPDIIYYKGTDGRYLGFNSAFENFTGDASLRGRWDDDSVIEERFDTGGPLDHRQLDEQVLSSGLSMRQEEWWSSGDGPRSCLDVLRTPYVGPRGETLGMVGIGRDITQRKAQEEMLRHAKEQAELTERYKIEFLAKISHELRTPLNAMMGLLQLMESTSLDDVQRDYRDRAFAASRILRDIVQEILDYAKIEANTSTLDEASFSLKSLVESLLDVMSFEARHKGLDLRLEYDATAPDLVVGDPLKLRSVLNNLLSNAVKFTEEGSVTLAVSRLEGDFGGSSIKFAVIDTGSGVDMSRYETLFQPFFQGVNATTRESAGGSGLGLSICRRIVEKMGGQLHCDSEPGCGTEFSFSIRLGRIDDRGGRLAAGKNAAQLENLLAGKTILLVEDSNLNREITAELLGQSGLVVDQARDGLEAYEAIQRRNYAAVLMDVQMPQMDGYQATRLIRSVIAEDRLPIIALTAHGMHEERQRAFEAGMNAFVRKPVEKAQLLSVIADVITSRESCQTIDKPLSCVAGASSGAIDLGSFFDQMGDHGRGWHFLRRFQDENVDIADRLERVLERGDCSLAWRITHEFKSISGIVFARELSRVAQRLENRLRADDVDEARIVLAELRSELRRVMEEISLVDAVRSQSLEPDVAGTGGL